MLKNVLCTVQSSGRDLNKLPVETLLNVRDLTLCFRTLGNQSEVEDPAAWSQLTSLTKLRYQIETEGSLRVRYRPPSPPKFYMPKFLIQMKSLRDIGVTVMYTAFERSGEGYILSLIYCLPQLSKLRFDIEEEESVQGLPDRQRLGDICIRVKFMVPELVYTLVRIIVPGRVHETYSRLCCSKRFSRLVFTIER
jgi:hypothetical protein